MAKVYDVIVAGGGLGGLSAACFLARAGRRVLLLERHNVPGGYATSFVRGRYEFEVALHELSGIGPNRNNNFYRYLEGLGVAERVELLPVTHLYRSLFPGVDVTLPSGEEAYIQALCDHFPGAADGIRTFMARVLKLEAEVSQLEARFTDGGLSPSLLAQVPLRFPNTLRYLPLTWGEVLDRDVSDPEARAVLSQYWGYFGLPPSRVSFFYFALALASYVRWGAAYVKGRSQALSLAFVQALEQWGGEVRTGRAVERVLSRNGRVTGVVTDDGRELACRALVSNVDPITLCQDLIGVEQVPASFWRRLVNSRIGPSSVNVYVGAGRSVEDFGLRDHEVFVNNDFDMDDHHRRMGRISAPGAIAVTCYNTVYPDISPPGTSITVLTALAYGDPWTRVAPQDYLDTKHRIADTMFDMAERVMPGLREHAEVVEVSTPVTNMRYAGNVNGAIYGFEQPPWDHTVVRLGHAGPLAGCYMAGAWVQPGGGFQPAIMSGQIAGGMTLNWLGKQ